MGGVGGGYENLVFIEIGSKWSRHDFVSLRIQRTWKSAQLARLPKSSSWKGHSDKSYSVVSVCKQNVWCVLYPQSVDQCR